MKDITGDLHSQKLMHVAGIACAATVVGIFTWLLLIPDPYAASRAFEPIRQANVSGYLIHPCVYFLMTVLTLMNVPTEFRDSQKPWLGGVGVMLVMLVIHGLSTEILQHFVPGRSCDPLDALANLTGISIGFAADRLRHQLFGTYWRLMQVATLIDTAPN
ncbi:VanZ family protein [bacterium]|nr:VanZ family protein [bacterium]